MSDQRRPDVCSTCHIELCETCHACRCNRGEDWTCGFSYCPAARAKHSGPDTKFCVLCLSGEHERVDKEAEELPPHVRAARYSAAGDEMAASLVRDGFGDDEIADILRDPPANTDD